MVGYARTRNESVSPFTMVATYRNLRTQLFMLYGAQL
jgi:hypothetical protein